MRLLWFALLGLIPSARPAPDLEGQAALAKVLVERRVANRWNAGIVVGLLEGDATKVVAAGTGAPQALDGRTVFEIGSMSKAFTGILLAEAVERKEVDPDQPVAELLPAAIREKFTDDKAKTTLRHLAQHRSGLAGMPDNFKPKDSGNPYADFSVEQMYDYLGRCRLNSPPGGKYEYSNLGMGLLGHVLALKAGGDYEGLLVARICDPLKMTRTRVTFTPEMRDHLARGHDARGLESANWDIPTLAGAGGIRSTVDDLLLFARANLAPPAIPLAPALRRAQAERQRIRPTFEMGLGWHITSVAGREIVWHNGQTGGYHSYLGLDVKNRRAVAILTNTALSIDDLGLHLLEPRSPTDPAREKPRGGGDRKVATLEAKQRDALVGEYALSAGFSITVTHEDGRMMAQATGQEKVEIFPESETKFFYKVVDAQLTFEKGADGRATQLTLHQNGRDLPGKRVN